MCKLILEKFESDDFNHYFLLVSNEQVMKMITEQSIPLKEARDKFSMILNRNKKYEPFGTFKVFNEKNDFVGLGSLILSEEKNEAELGYMLLPAYWGKGYGSRIAEILIKMARDAKVNQLTAIIDPINIPSRKILLNNGFMSEKVCEIEGLPGEIMTMNLGGKLMNIRILNEEDAQSYQKVRLSALKNNTEAFGSTYEREVNFSLATVKERIVPSADCFVLGAFDEACSLIGIVTFMRENGTKMRHKGNVYGMYVVPENRGQGVSKLLMTELIRMAKKCDDLEQLNLAVVSDNEAAKKLYQSLGFKVYGVERNALKFAGQYFDEDLMVLYI